MKPIEVQRLFVNDLPNVRNANSMMSGLALVEGEGRLGCLSSTPGRGKTWWSQVWAANNDAVYFRVAKIWRDSELEFMQALCRELGIVNPPGRKGRCYAAVVEKLIGTDRPVFIDEVQRLHKDFLTIILDLSDATACPFVLVGEPELKTMMQGHARVWSRTFYELEFEAISVSDLSLFAMAVSKMRLPNSVANILHKASHGDLRVVRRDLIALARLVNAQGPGPDGEPQITDEMAKTAVKVGLSAVVGNGNGNGKTVK